MMQPKGLLWIERGAVLSLFVLFLVWLIQSKAPVVLAKNEEVRQDSCLIQIEGAVQKPGIYQAFPSDRLKDVIKKASPQGANLKNVTHKLIGKIRHVIVPEKGEVAVFIENAVGEIVCIIAPESISVLELTESDALKKALHKVKNRRVKNFETFSQSD